MRWTVGVTIPRGEKNLCDVREHGAHLAHTWRTLLTFPELSIRVGLVVVSLRATWPACQLYKPWLVTKVTGHCSSPPCCRAFCAAKAWPYPVPTQSWKNESDR